MSSVRRRRLPLVAPRFICDELFVIGSVAEIWSYFSVTAVLVVSITVLSWIYGNFLMAIIAAALAIYAANKLYFLHGKIKNCRWNFRRAPDQPKNLYEYDSDYDSNISEDLFEEILEGKERLTSGQIICHLATLREVNVDDAAMFVDAFWGYVLPGKESYGRPGWRYDETGHWAVVIPRFGSFSIDRDKGMYFRSRNNDNFDGETLGDPQSLDLEKKARSTHRWARPVLEKTTPVSDLSVKRRITWFISGATGLSLPKVTRLLEYFLALLLYVFDYGDIDIHWHRRGRMLPCPEYKGRNPRTGEFMHLPRARYYLFEPSAGLRSRALGEES